jgi:hypothetical protein
MFRDISGRGSDAAKRNPVLASDYDGSVRFASNIESLYRSWGPRRWTVDKVDRGSTKGRPFADADEHKGPAKWRIAP